jgi:hypothetical protein
LCKSMSDERERRHQHQDDRAAINMFGIHLDKEEET